MTIYKKTVSIYMMNKYKNNKYNITKLYDDDDYLVSIDRTFQNLTVIITPNYI